MLYQLSYNSRWLMREFPAGRLESLPGPYQPCKCDGDARSRGQERGVQRTLWGTQGRRLNIGRIRLPQERVMYGTRTRDPRDHNPML